MNKCESCNKWDSSALVETVGTRRNERLMARRWKQIDPGVIDRLMRFRSRIGRLGGVIFLIGL